MSADFPAVFHSLWREPPTELCELDKSQNVKDRVRIASEKGRPTYPVNGVPISQWPLGCCVNDYCYCRSDVIFYGGIAYDQKPYITGRLRTRPDDVIYYEGKMVPPFLPGKSPAPYGHFTKKDKYKPNSFVPRDNTDLMYTSKGLPYGETLGFFRFKPDKTCDCREIPIQRIAECCQCDPFEYNPAFYETDECPYMICCC